MPQWGCIADDVTGATDLATNLVSRGLRTKVVLGTPGEAAIRKARTEFADVDAIVVALKTRTAPVAQAVAESLAALRLLRAAGAARSYVKYCSTFDSTPRGNIGPVIDAVLDARGEELTVVVPSFPATGRTVYQGHLFVGDQLLSDSSMRHHPLTPMLDSSLPRLLAPQTTGTVALVPLPVVREGVAAVRAALEDARVPGTRVHAVVDALTVEDLAVIAEATAGLAVVTGGSGLALGLPRAGDPDAARAITVRPGLRATLCGSASERTRAQVAHARERVPWRKLDLGALRADFAGHVGGIVTWARQVWAADATALPLVYSVDSLSDLDGDTPEGAEPASELVERALAAVAEGLVAEGARQLVVAGGESSGRVLAELGIGALRIGPEIASGVAWSDGVTEDGVPLNLALKSGNFGEVGMFTTAWDSLATAGAAR
ncbi:3-oxo-tetronate kinase [Prauserella flavalba]|uniref:3-oxo-tetronate kinase n=1 Tax=Prauserella flavalba TaxID=1477506 RepID=A0A318LPB3_9PSEU|nr:3-oxo-tetronate kinase [Prauserella flavalba]PXY35380.1 Hrp-dependent type III effector protein [Prauserella flavalba]